MKKKEEELKIDVNMENAENEKVALEDFIKEKLKNFPSDPEAAKNYYDAFLDQQDIIQSKAYSIMDVILEHLQIDKKNLMIFQIICQEGIVIVSGLVRHAIQQPGKPMQQPINLPIPVECLWCAPDKITEVFQEHMKKLEDEVKQQEQPPSPILH